MMAVIGLQQRDVFRPRSLKTRTQFGRDGSAFASDCYSHVSIDGIEAGEASTSGYVRRPDEVSKINGEYPRDGGRWGCVSPASCST